MNGFKWAAVIILAFDGLVYISKTGQPRKPISGSDAVLGVVEFAILIALVVLA